MSNESTIFHNFWESLPNEERIQRLFLAYEGVKPLAQEQLNRIEQIEKKKNLRSAAFWMFTIIRSFWDDAEFIIELSKTAKKYHGFPYIRVLFEKLFRLKYLFQQTPEEQEIITEKELLKMCALFYKRYVKEGKPDLGQEFKEHYQKGNTFGFPPIEEVKIEELKTFPSMELMINQSGIYEPITWYFHYRILSEAGHASLMYQVMRDLDHDGDYRRALMFFIVMSYKMLEWTDIALGFQMKDRVQAEIQRGKKIGMDGMPEI